MKILNLLIFVVAGALAVLLTADPGTFLYSREGIRAGEFWRLFTGHFVHFTSQHLAGNLAALALLLLLLPRMGRLPAFWLGVCTPLLLALALYATRLDLAFYGGISGWLSALFVYVALARAREAGWSRHFFRVGLLLFAMKLASEWMTGKSLFTNIEGGVLVETAAHLFGAILGVAGYALSQTSFRTAGAAKPQPVLSEEVAFPMKP